MITVLGLGFVGLTTALGFSKKGFKTYGIDVDQKRIDSIKKSKIPFYEPGLTEALQEELGKNFIIDASLKQAVNDSKVIYLCVGTPGNADGSADLTYLFKAVENIYEQSEDGFKVVVIKSTVPPSTASKKVQPFIDQLNAKYNRNLALASNPEFLREGYAWDDFINPDRVVLGVESAEAKELLNKVYAPFNAPIYYLNTNSAEFIKYLSNTLLSTLISYSNEMSMIADHIGGIDVASAFKILHQDKRFFGTPAQIASYVYPGCGYGGYCLPKDTAALVSIAKDHGFTPKILEGNLATNEMIKEFLSQKILDSVAKESKIGILGLSFKSGSDDVRLSPSKFIIEGLMEKGYKNIVAFDPMANEAFDKEHNLPISYADSLESLVSEADELVLLTSWPEFKKNKELVTSKRLFDFRYVFYDLEKISNTEKIGAN